ncbi:hypothetical protein F5Y04DRAFT_257216 [Hypomontagnella monticulosa]|nr:hypothetical protein F5Y04DRAFT_257216 [Hypomontagnella monticulosa]
MISSPYADIACHNFIALQFYGVRAAAFTIMERHSRRTREPQADRRRSRSPATSGNQDETGSPSRTRHHTWSLPPTSHRELPEDFMEKLAAATQAFEAERERHRNLDPMERLREDGQELQRKILSNQNMSVTFEVSRSSRARCRAEDDCLHVQAEFPTGKTIIDNCRTRVDGVNDPLHWHPATYYYHVLCFDQMVDLVDLIPNKFQLAGHTAWGLMIRKWFEYKGCIDLEKLAIYIEAVKAYKEKILALSTPWIEWDHGHRQCEADKTPCTCPPRPEAPEEPVLKNDYTTTEEERCSLGELVEHPNFDDICDQFWFTGRGLERVRVIPEIEERSEQSGRDLTTIEANDHMARIMSLYI